MSGIPHQDFPDVSKVWSITARGAVWDYGNYAQLFGARWQTKCDTALDFGGQLANPKRRRRFALPAHSKVKTV